MYWQIGLIFPSLVGYIQQTGRREGGRLADKIQVDLFQNLKSSSIQFFLTLVQLYHHQCILDDFPQIKLILMYFEVWKFGCLSISVTIMIIVLHFYTVFILSWINTSIILFLDWFRSTYSDNNIWIAPTYIHVNQ